MHHSISGIPWWSFCNTGMAQSNKALAASIVASHCLSITSSFTQLSGSQAIVVDAGAESAGMELLDSSLGSDACSVLCPHFQEMVTVD